ncbi:MAG: hypothetical protein R3F39_09405 [Myxococcota bacterium]
MRQTMMMLGGLTAVLLTQACGGGLSYKVGEDALKTLSAEQRVKADVSSQEVTAAKRLIGDMDAQIEQAKADAERADERVDKAKKAVDDAEDKIDKADADLKAKLKAADKLRDAAEDFADTRYKASEEAAKAEHAAKPDGPRMDQAIDAADSIRDADKSVARATYEQTEAVAKGEHGKVQDTNRKVLADKQQALKLEQARFEYADAVVDERKARKKALTAAWWTAQAKYELVKYEAVAEARGGDKTEDEQKKHRQFQEQFTDREAKQREAEQEVAQMEQQTAKAKRAFDALNPDPVTPPAPAPAAPAPAPAPDAEEAGPDA